MGTDLFLLVLKLGDESIEVKVATFGVEHAIVSLEDGFQDLEGEHNFISGIKNSVEFDIPLKRKRMVDIVSTEHLPLFIKQLNQSICRCGEDIAEWYFYDFN